MTKEHSLRVVREQTALAETYVGDGAYITAASVLRRLADQLQAKGEAAAADLAKHMNASDRKRAAFDAPTKPKRRTQRRNMEAQAAYDDANGTDNGFARWDDQRSAGEY